MKKITIIACIALSLISFNGYSQAKTKFGHINYTEVIKLMPGIDTAQNKIVELQKELQAAGQEMAKEFQLKQDEYMRSENKYTPAVAKVKEQELQSMYARLEEFSRSMEMELQEKQLEYLKPFQEKLLNAIKEVAKEQNFAYIFDISTLLFYESGEDITVPVKQKLGIK